MPQESATATLPQNGTSRATPAATPLRMHTRVRHGLSKPHNWIQLFKFFAVGGSGYVVNLAVFALCNGPLHFHHLVSATLAFVFGVVNNFWWNRHWTFGARDGHAGFQAARFFAVSVAAFVFAAAILQLLVTNTSIPTIVAQAISLVAATPLNFLGNKMWSFAGSSTVS